MICMFFRFSFTLLFILFFFFNFLHFHGVIYKTKWQNIRYYVCLGIKNVLESCLSVRQSVSDSVSDLVTMAHICQLYGPGKYEKCWRVQNGCIYPSNFWIIKKHKQHDCLDYFHIFCNIYINRHTYGHIYWSYTWKLSYLISIEVLIVLKLYKF